MAGNIQGKLSNIPEVTERKDGCIFLIRDLHTEYQHFEKGIATNY